MENPSTYIKSQVSFLIGLFNISQDMVNGFWISSIISSIAYAYLSRNRVAFMKTHASSSLVLYPET